jgi:hypothetical protein
MGQADLSTSRALQRSSAWRQAVGDLHDYYYSALSSMCPTAQIKLQSTLEEHPWTSSGRMTRLELAHEYQLNYIFGRENARDHAQTSIIYL